jgi:hypothetical protein
MCTYNQVADKNLEDLCFQACAVLKHSLENADEDVAERSGDKGTVRGHLRDSGREITSMSVPIFGDPRGKKFLRGRERSRRKHLRPQRITLELVEIGLIVSVRSRPSGKCGNIVRLTAK